MLPSNPIRYLSVCSGTEAFSVAVRGLPFSPVAFSEIEPFPLVGICVCAGAHSSRLGCPLRKGFLHSLRAPASSMRTKSAFFAAASSLPPFPPLQGDRPHGHKGTVGASKKMGPPGGGHLPRCLATPRNGGFFRIKSRGQTDKQLRYARRIGTGDTVPSGDASRKLYGASPRGGQDVR